MKSSESLIEKILRIIAAMGDASISKDETLGNVPMQPGYEVVALPTPQTLIQETAQKILRDKVGLTVTETTSTITMTPHSFNECMKAALNESREISVVDEEAIEKELFFSAIKTQENLSGDKVVTIALYKIMEIMRPYLKRESGEDVEKLRDGIRWLLPLAKGYAYAHPDVKSNYELIEAASNLIEGGS